MANIDNLMEMLSEYQEGELSDWGKMYLKDELIRISEKLHQEEITEGHCYDGMMILVEKGAEIPHPIKNTFSKVILLMK